jgi:hypothetical protein
MVRVLYHDPEHGGSIYLTTLSLSMGRRVRVRQAHPTSEVPRGRSRGRELVESVESATDYCRIELAAANGRITGLTV